MNKLSRILNDDDGISLEENDAMDAVKQQLENNISQLTTESEWALSGTQFHPATRASKSPKLPPGVYRYAASPQGWWLERTAAKFEFPFKVYNASGHIIERIKKCWKNERGNLGILMNGTRGAGKTMNAQILSNELIEEQGIPVLVVRFPIPLQVVFDAVQQDLIVIFDEFEKSHDEQQHPGAQQALLSTIDGMSRSEHERLIIFTTNNTVINENFRDRPSRIRYRFEFTRVADEIIEGLVDDSLPKHLAHFKPDIFEFLNSRKICTIDIVKAVISEVKIFEESPLQFEDILNIAKGEPPAFTIEILHPKTGNVQGVFSRYFRLEGHHNTIWTPLLTGNKRSIENFIEAGQFVNLRSRSWDGECHIQLMEVVPDEEGTFLAQLSGPRSKTIYKDFEFLGDGYTLWLDDRPADWKFPFTRETVKKDEEAMSKLQEIWWEAVERGTVHATGKRATFKIRFTANRDTIMPSSMHVPSTDLSGWQHV